MYLRLTELATQRGARLNADEVRVLHRYGLASRIEARAVLDALAKSGAFHHPLSAERRALLAALTRAAEIGPRLAVDNSASGPGTSFSGAALEPPCVPSELFFDRHQ